MHRKWEELYEKHLNLTGNCLSYGIRWRSLMGFRHSWSHLKSAIRIAWYQING